MFRIIRTATLRTLQADAAQLANARMDADSNATEAARWQKRHREADTAFGGALKDLAQARADQIKAERERNQAIAQREQDKTETDRQMAEIRDDLAKIRAAAADTENGETVRAALAYHVLRDMYADAWNQGLLPKRPFDLIAVLLDFQTADQPTATPTA